MTQEEQLYVFARTIRAEARGEPLSGQIAVAWTIRNRSTDKNRRWPRTIAGVCLQPLQFSCWNPDDPNSETIASVTLENQALVRAFGVACLVMANDLPDASKGANHYMRADYVERVKWDNKMERTVAIGAHVFFRG